MLIFNLDWWVPSNFNIVNTTIYKYNKISVLIVNIWYKETSKNVYYFSRKRVIRNIQNFEYSGLRHADSYFICFIATFTVIRIILVTLVFENNTTLWVLFYFKLYSAISMICQTWDITIFLLYIAFK